MDFGDFHFIFVRSSAKAALHVAKSPVPRIRTPVLQLVRSSEEHQFPRRFAESDAKVRPPIMHGAAFPRVARTQHHPLRSQTGEYPPLQS